MVELTDIVDQISLDTWLEGQPKDFTKVLSHRAAMRELPFFWRWMLTSDTPRRYAVPVLPILRAVITADALSSTNLHKDLNAAQKDVYLAASDVASSVIPLSSRAAIAAETVMNSVTNKVVAFNVSNSIIHGEEIYKQIASDCSALVHGENLRREDLFGKKSIPVSGYWLDIKSALARDKINWSFWIRWYEAALSGQPLNFDLIEQIALIPSGDWAKGPAHVNKLIAAIEAEFELKAKIAELEGKLLQISSSGRGIGDNQGPPMADEPVAKEIMIIWEPLQELKQEIEEKHPNRERLLAIAKKIGELAALILKWTAQKIDLAANTAVKVGTSAAVGVLVIRLTTEAKPVASMLTTISDLAVKLAGYLS